MHPKEREWLDKVMPTRPCSDGGRPKSDDIVAWLEKILPQQFKKAVREETDREHDRQKLSPPEWLIYQELVKIYDGKNWPWIIPYMWALKKRYHLVFRYEVEVVDGFIQYKF